MHLAEAHAKFMYRDQVLPMDAIQAVWIMEQSIKSSNVVNEYNVLQTSFPQRAAADYESVKEMIHHEIFDESARALVDIDWDYKKVIAERNNANELVAAEELVGMGMFEDDFDIETDLKENQSETENNDDNLNCNRNHANGAVCDQPGSGAVANGALLDQPGSQAVGDNDGGDDAANNESNCVIRNGGDDDENVDENNECVLDLSTLSTNPPNQSNNAENDNVDVDSGIVDRENGNSQIEVDDVDEAVEDDEIEYLSNASPNEEPLSGETIRSQSTLSHRSQLDEIEEDEEYVPGQTQLNVLSELAQNTQDDDLTQPTQMTQATQPTQPTQPTQRTQLNQQMISPLDPIQENLDNRQRRDSSSSTESESQAIISSTSTNQKKNNAVSKPSDDILTNDSNTTRLGQSTSPLDSNRNHNVAANPTVPPKDVVNPIIDMDDDEPPGLARRRKRKQQMEKRDSTQLRSILLKESPVKRSKVSDSALQS